MDFISRSDTQVTDESIAEFIALRADCLLRMFTGSELRTDGVPYSGRKYSWGADYEERIQQWVGLGYANNVPIGMNPIPCAPSSVRDLGIAAWDTTLNGAPTDRRPGLLALERILNTTPSFCRVNADWTNSYNARRRYGPLSFDPLSAGTVKGLIRPPYTYGADLLDSPQDAWHLIQVARGMAAKAVSYHTMRTTLVPGRGVLPVEFRAVLSEMIVCLLFDIPYDPHADNRTQLRMPYGIQVFGADDWTNPVLRVPVHGTEAPRPDKVAAKILVRTYTQPPPAAWGGRGSKKDATAFDCLPTIFDIVGIQGLDVCMNHTIASWSAQEFPQWYCVPAEDLLPGRLIPTYVELARRTDYELPTERHVNLREWLDSDEAEDVKEYAPPYPDLGTIYVQRMPAHVPDRPRGRVDHRIGLNVEKHTDEWKPYVRSIIDLLEVLTYAVGQLEAKIYGPHRARRRRTSVRKKQAELKTQTRNDECLKTIAKKTLQGRPLTENQQQHLATWKTANPGKHILDLL